MTQASYIPTSDQNRGAGLNFFTDVLQAIATLNSGVVAPTETYPLMLWFDEANLQLKMRNQQNTDWMILFYVNSSGTRAEAFGNNLTEAEVTDTENTVFGVVNGLRLQQAVQAFARSVPDAQFTYELPSGSNGAIVPSSFGALTLNTTRKPSGFVTLSGNQLTFTEGGDYWIDYWTKFHSAVDNQNPNAKSRVYNVTQDVTVFVGSPCVLSDNNTDTSIGDGPITVAAGDVIELQGHRSNTVTNGNAASGGENEVYTSLKVYRA